MFWGESGLFNFRSAKLPKTTAAQNNDRQIERVRLAQSDLGYGRYDGLFRVQKFNPDFHGKPVTSVNARRVETLSDPSSLVRHRHAPSALRLPILSSTSRCLASARTHSPSSALLAHPCPRLPRRAASNPRGCNPLPAVLVAELIHIAPDDRGELRVRRGHESEDQTSATRRSSTSSAALRR